MAQIYQVEKWNFTLCICDKDKENCIENLPKKSPFSNTRSTTCTSSMLQPCEDVPLTCNGEANQPSQNKDKLTTYHKTKKDVESYPSTKTTKCKNGTLPFPYVMRIRKAVSRTCPEISFFKHSLNKLFFLNAATL